MELLGIVEREFIGNLYNTGLTDQKTILYKYWKNITCIFIELYIVQNDYLKYLKYNLLRINIGKTLLVII